MIAEVKALRGARGFRKVTHEPMTIDVRVSVGDEFTIRGATFRVTYVNARGSFTSEPIRGIVRSRAGGPPCSEQR